MKIAIFTPSFLPKTGGAEIFHHNLARRLVQVGCETTVILPRKQARALMESGWQLPYQIEPFPSNAFTYFKRSRWFGNLFAGTILSRLQKKHRFDCWHGVMFYPTAPALVPWAVRRGIPHLIRAAGDDVLSSKGGEVGVRLDAKVNELVLPEILRARLVVALSETMEQEFRAIGVSPERIRTIPNAVDHERFSAPIDRSAIRARLGLAPDRFTFLSVGRNHPQKNYPVLLEAARLLAEAKADFQLLIVGRDCDALREEAAKLGIADRVAITTVQPRRGGIPDFPPDELIEIYRCADAFVMPSLLEGFSTALLEAMTAGLPVLTTDAPGCVDFVRGGEDALVVPAGSLPPLRDAMRSLIEQPDLRSQYSEKSLKRSREFTWEHVTSSYVKTYRELVETPPR